MLIEKVDERNLREAGWVHSRSWQESHREFCTEEFVQAHDPIRQTGYIQRRIGDGSRFFILNDPEPVAVVSRTGNEIGDLYVLPEHHNKGYGTVLLEYAVSLSAEDAELWVLDNNLKAQKLYERLGFRLSGRVNPITEKLLEKQMVLSRPRGRRPACFYLDGRVYTPVKLLGRGKGGYSWLVKDEEGREVTLKQLHHEPCAYYSFGDKMQSEMSDYETLYALGIALPERIAFDRERELILKEYIQGSTVLEKVLSGQDVRTELEQAERMSEVLRNAGLNIDWFPSNFISRNGTLCYVDYECNEYHEKWSLENWGVLYWKRTPELEKWLEEQKN